MTLAGFLICLFKVRQGFEYVADFKYVGLVIWRGFEYARVLKGVEYN